jgi:hypothetical protein
MGGFEMASIQMKKLPILFNLKSKFNAPPAERGRGTVKCETNRNE